jgi:hypothetical protein
VTLALPQNQPAAYSRPPPSFPKRRPSTQLHALSCTLERKRELKKIINGQNHSIKRNIGGRPMLLEKEGRRMKVERKKKKKTEG